MRSRSGSSSRGSPCCSGAAEEDEQPKEAAERLTGPKEGSAMLLLELQTARAGGSLSGAGELTSLNASREEVLL